MRRLAAALALLLGAACSGGEPPAPPAREALVVVNAALGESAGRQIERGAQLAVDRINRDGGVRVGGGRVRLSVSTMDTKGSPAVAAENARAALARGPVAILGGPEGMQAVQADAATIGLPLMIVRDGGPKLDPRTMPNVFRIAPSNEDLAIRFREHLVPQRVNIAVLHDDDVYGRDALIAAGAAFSDFRDRIVGSLAIEGDGSAQVEAARTAGAAALVIWASPASTAKVIASARRAGWQGSIYTGPSGVDPAVRVALARQPAWLTGVIATIGRLGGGPDASAYDAFRSKYEQRFGPDVVQSVRQGGREVVDPPRWAMYSSDAVNLLAVAMTRAERAAAGPPLLSAMRSVRVIGSNGAPRSFGSSDHDAVDRDEIALVRFTDFVWVAVKDDARSAALPDVRQIR